MRLLDRKVLRDAVHLKGQFLAVAVLVGCGVAVYIMLRSMNGYLRDSQANYYAEYGFGEVFAWAKRVPAPVEDRLAAVDGVDRVYTRLVRDVLLDVPGLPEPATGRLVSIPDHGPPALNRLLLRTGALPDPGRRDQVVVSSAFAKANELRVGDTFGAVVNGRWQRLTIVGTAISPEFIYEVNAVGSMFPDNRRFGAMWMSVGAMTAAFEMEGAFNDVVATLVPGASEPAVLADFDDILEPYGGIGAYGRDGHVSDEFVSSEIEETDVTASFFPGLFLIITVFLLHTTLLRLVRMEREQIGLLKAFGFSSGTIAVHYVKLALVPVTAGAVVGSGLGIWLAGQLAGVYAQFYQFPESDFHLDPAVLYAALGIAFATGVAGAVAAARSVVRLTPAVAMAPPAPPRFHRGRLEIERFWNALAMTGRMIVRNIARSRWKSLSTGAGVAMALGVLVALLSMFDSIDVIRDIQFEHVYREDLAVYFDAPRSDDAIREVLHLPGVIEAEPIRTAPARIMHDHRERRVGLLGLEPDGRLRRIVDADFRVHRPPAEGVLLSRMLAERLHVAPGSVVRVEVTEGTRPSGELVVAGIVDELMGGEVYMEAGTLEALLDEPLAVSGAWLKVDAASRDELYATLKRLPGVASVLVKDVIVQGFDETIQESFYIMLDSTLLLGVALVMAIVYNQARVALSERGRELASLRVLGFSRREVARMLLGEQAVIVLVALPFGLLLGWALTWLAMHRFESDMFRLPVIVFPRTYAFSAALVLFSTAMSALLVRRRLDRIDLIGVLKTRE
jgi:putative ABC transport system permease protein